jgi:uncharacterized protein
MAEATTRTPVSGEESLLLRVGESTIPGAGHGLFAVRSFPSDTVVCVYRGKELRTAEAAKLKTHERDYLMRIGPQCYVDASAPDSCLARFINDARRAAKQNCWFDKVLPTSTEPGHALVKSLRAIEAGEELFCSYGQWYWAGHDRATHASPSSSTSPPGVPVDEACSEPVAAGSDP